jgi:hypothetical protein
MPPRRMVSSEAMVDSAGTSLPGAKAKRTFRTQSWNRNRESLWPCAGMGTKPVTEDRTLHRYLREPLELDRLLWYPESAYEQSEA